MGRTHTKGVSGGKPFDLQFQFTDTFVNQGGHWRLLAGHVSKLPAKEIRRDNRNPVWPAGVWSCAKAGLCYNPRSSSLPCFPGKPASGAVAAAVSAAVLLINHGSLISVYSRNVNAPALLRWSNF